VASLTEQAYSVPTRTDSGSNILLLLHMRTCSLGQNCGLMWTQNCGICTSLVGTAAPANKKARCMQASLLAVYALGMSPPSSLPYSVTDGAMPALVGLMHAPGSKRHSHCSR